MHCINQVINRNHMDEEELINILINQEWMNIWEISPFIIRQLIYYCHLNVLGVIDEVLIDSFIICLLQDYPDCLCFIISLIIVILMISSFSRKYIMELV